MKLLKRKYSVQLAGLLAADLLLFSLSDAQKVPSWILIVAFVLLVATVYSLVYGVLSFVSLYGITFKRKRRLSYYLTGFVALMVALTSVGDINSRDVLVLIPLVLIGYMYSFYSQNGLRKTNY